MITGIDWAMKRVFFYNSCEYNSLLLLFATTSSVVKSVKLSVVEEAKRTN